MARAEAVDVLDDLEGDDDVERLWPQARGLPVVHVPDDVRGRPEIEPRVPREAARPEGGAEPAVAGADLEDARVARHVREEVVDLAELRDAAEERHGDPRGLRLRAGHAAEPSRLGPCCTPALPSS